MKSLLAGGFDGIYTGDAQAIDKANKTLTLKRKLMLMSPDVNVDKMLTVKFDLGERANFVGAGSLGIQPNNWSNLSSASRKNFKAQLVELSGLQSGELSEKVLYKPAVDGSSVTDLVLNWDGKRLMFTALDTTRRWQVHELISTTERLSRLPISRNRIWSSSMEPICLTDVCWRSPISVIKAYLV